jgi:hypothetical protein
MEPEARGISRAESSALWTGGRSTGGHWSESPALLLGYVVVVLAGAVAIVLFILSPAPLPLRLLAPVAYVALLTVGTRELRWAGFVGAILVALLSLAGGILSHRVDPTTCINWNRELNAAELSQLHKGAGLTVAQLFTDQEGGNASTAFSRWRHEGGNC